MFSTFEMNIFNNIVREYNPSLRYRYSLDNKEMD